MSMDNAADLNGSHPPSDGDMIFDAKPLTENALNRRMMMPKDKGSRSAQDNGNGTQFGAEYKHTSLHNASFLSFRIGFVSLLSLCQSLSTFASKYNILVIQYDVDYNMLDDNEVSV